jgi:hypothetical protein
LTVGLVVLIDGQRFGGGVIIFFEILIEILNYGGFIGLLILFFKHGLQLIVVELLFIDDVGQPIHFD